MYETQAKLNIENIIIYKFGDSQKRLLNSQFYMVRIFHFEQDFTEKASRFFKVPSLEPPRCSMTTQDGCHDSHLVFFSSNINLLKKKKKSNPVHFILRQNCAYFLLISIMALLTCISSDDFPKIKSNIWFLVISQ